MGGITYDTGALIAAERNDRMMWAIHRRALERGQRPTVPAAVLGQAWRGGPQAELSRLVAGCRIEALDETRARNAGTVCARAGTADVTDATVVIGALARNDAVVTSDMSDLTQLLHALGADLDLIGV